MRKVFGPKQKRHTNGKKKTRQGMSINRRYGTKTSKSIIRNEVEDKDNGKEKRFKIN